MTVLVSKLYILEVFSSLESYVGMIFSRSDSSKTRLLIAIWRSHSHGGVDQKPQIVDVGGEPAAEQRSDKLQNSLHMIRDRESLFKVQSSILVLRDRRWSENGTSDLDLRDSFCISYSYQLKLSTEYFMRLIRLDIPGWRLLFSLGKRVISRNRRRKLISRRINANM